MDSSQVASKMAAIRATKVLPAPPKESALIQNTTPVMSPIMSPSATPQLEVVELSKSKSGRQIKRAESLLKNTLRICEDTKTVVEHDDNTETISAVCELLENEECELTVVPNRCESIAAVLHYVIACDDLEFGLSHYMKPLKTGDKSVSIRVKNSIFKKREIQLLCTVMFE